eukprot:658841-Alexandrium_andersonii.AAC.1
MEWGERVFMAVHKAMLLKPACPLAHSMMVHSHCGSNSFGRNCLDSYHRSLFFPGTSEQTDALKLVHATHDALALPPHDGL